MRRLLMMAALTAAPALAEELPPRISVTGSATVSTPPDRATIGFTVHGEGATSDEAVTAMVAKRKAIEAGLGRFAAKAETSVSRVAVNDARAPSCNRAGYGVPRLATGDCVIVGYTADITMTIRTSAAGDAGTIVGLIGRLGGTNPTIERFSLSDDGAAQKRAVTAAIADARRQAEALAEGAGVKLGAVVQVSNMGFFGQPFADIVVSGTAAPPPPPPPPPPPIAIDLKPRLIDTQARVTLVYAIAR